MKKISLILSVIMILCSNAYSEWPFGDTTQIVGTYYTNIKNDTMTIRYEISPLNFDPDSMMLEIFGLNGNEKLDVNNFRDSANNVIIYRSSDELPFNNSWNQAFKKGEKLYLSGSIRVPLEKQRTEFMVLNIKGFYTDEGQESQVVVQDEYISNGMFALGMEFWFPSFGYFNSNMKEPLDKKGLFLGYGLSMEMHSKCFRTMISTSWSGFGKNFAFSEPFRAGTRYYLTGSRNSWIPQIYSAIKLTKFKLKKDDVEFRKVDWGGEFGIAWESSFERIGYHYSTALGGYHTAELYLSIISGKRTRFGTRYQFQKHDDIWTIRISAHIEGWRALAGSRYFRKLNNRPLPHKILALVGLGPTAIVSLPFWLLGIDGK